MTTVTISQEEYDDLKDVKLSYLKQKIKEHDESIAKHGPITRKDLGI